MNIIQTENLTKKFGDTLAVDNVSINVRQGEIYGFLGLNGAGKTTTIRLILGMIKPDSGSVSLFGNELSQGSEVWKDVGYIVEASDSYPNLTVEENLKVYYHLRGLRDEKLIDNVINTLQLAQYRNRRAQHLSMGNKQRLGLAKALMHNPKLLLLDEPINGLDPSGIVEIREFLKKIVTNGNTTIFLSSHILSEISKLATRIGIVHNGKLIKEINSSDLDKLTLRKLVVNTFDNTGAGILLTEKSISCSVMNNFIEITDEYAIQHPDVIATALVNAGFPPKMLNLIEEDLESYFLRTINSKEKIHE